MSAGQLSYGTVYFRSILRLLSEVDWWLTLATCFLIFVGLQTLHSTDPAGLFYGKQVDFIIAGALIGLIFWRIPYNFWTQKWVVVALYLLNLGLLVAVMVLGHSALGAQRWLSLGPVTLQPSELAKILVIFTLSAWLRTRPIRGLLDIMKVLALILPAAVLVFKQPDLGTSLTFGAIFFGMSFWAGATVADVLVLVSPVASLILHALNIDWWLWYLLLLTFGLLAFWKRPQWNFLVRLALVLVVLTVNLGCGVARPHLWGLLKEYQQKRLTSFVNPYSDPRGSGYHILQSLIAIGSGGVQGAGLGKGNQSQGAFIPEKHTDFIFAVVGEELGFKISALVILAYAIICMRALIIAYQSRQESGGSLMAIGLMSMFLFHVFLNIGMTMGIMPVAGVPLPFLSYGGTAAMVDLLAIGLLQSIRRINPPPRRGIFDE